jgi:hypothetical protein
VFKADAGVAGGLFDQSLEVLVVAVAAVGRESVGPLPGEVTDG